MKRVYKITPVSMYDVRGMESWLEDMALRGLALKRIRPLFSTFEEGPARKTRYRAEPYCQRVHEDLPQDMLDLYQDFGWTLVCAIKDFLIFSTQDQDAPEPHSDPELQGQQWQKLYRRNRRNFIVCLFLALAAAVLAFQILFFQGTPILNLIETSILWSFVTPVIMFASLPQMWGNVQQLSLIVRQLEAGVPLDHRIAYPRRRWIEAASFLTCCVLMVLLLYSQFVLPFLGGDIRPLDELTAFPMLSLAEVEGENFTPRPVVMSGKDYANFCALRHYLLCPNWWRVVQSGNITPDEWVRMEIEWYDLPGWLSFLSAPLARELLDRAMGLDQELWWTDNSGAAWTVDYYPQEDVGFLAAANRVDEDFHIAVAARGDKAVLVRYTGHGDLAEHLSEFMAMVTGEEAV